MLAASHPESTRPYSCSTVAVSFSHNMPDMTDFQGYRGTDINPACRRRLPVCPRLVERYMVKRFFRCCGECGESSRFAMLSVPHCTAFLFLAFRVCQWYIGHRSYTAQQQPCSSTCPPPTPLRTTITHPFNPPSFLSVFPVLCAAAVSQLEKSWIGFEFPLVRDAQHTWENAVAMVEAAFGGRFKLIRRNKGKVRCDLAISKLGLKSHAHIE